MPSPATFSVLEAWGNRARLRSAVCLDGADERILIYDLERTFVFDVPPEFHDAIQSLRQTEFAADEFRLWLLKQDLMTCVAPPQWQEADSSLLPEVTDVAVDLSGDCNMGCRYCYEEPIHSRGGRMDRATLSATLDFVFQKATGGDGLSVHFGSGEPLIQFGLLRELVSLATARAERLGIRLGFELTTNATLVNAEIAEFLAAHPFNVRVSCDGPAPIHDRYRLMASGRPSYDRVLRGLKALLAVMPERVTVNSVICSGTRLATIWSWAKSQGLRHLHVVKVGSNQSDPASMNLDELSDYGSDLDSICEDMLDELASGRRPIDFQPVTKVVRRLMLPGPINRFCGVAGSYLGVATDGTVYPCFRHLGVARYRLGDVRNGVDDEARRRYRQHEGAGVDARPHCRSCWARYMCGGGCYADSVFYGPDPLAPQLAHCPFWQAEIARGIRFYDRLRIIDPSSCLRLFGDDPEDHMSCSDLDASEFLKKRKTF